MSNAVAEISTLLKQDDSAKWVTQMWSTYHAQRAEKTKEWLELRDYVFATDTTSTSNASLPWKNTTTTPKLCQIRDNLHSNYLSALFPNDNWLKWMGHGKDDNVKAKRDAIQAYMANKVREGGLRTEYSKLVYDYIDYGNAFVTTSFEANYKELENGELVPLYVGPTAVRISPMDIVFNPLAKSFDASWKIVRSVKTLGEIKKLAVTEPEQAFWGDVVERREKFRSLVGGYTIEDFDKAAGYCVDGFGNMQEYLQSDYVEVLEFYGDYYNSLTGELSTDRVITIADRSITARNEAIPSWLGKAPIHHVGWRGRPDNLWSMGPLDNLVGLQYRLDHITNASADAKDLIIHPPLAVVGDVDEFRWGPEEVIQMQEGGDIKEISKSLQGVVSMADEAQTIMDTMELMAGAPREAMGIRTPGEKTLGEVNQLANAAGRIFQEKINSFEINLLEPNLNDQLETARRNMDATDIIRVMDDDLGVEKFVTITKEDITAVGKLRPVGARHFAQQSQDLQNVMAVFNSPIGEKIAPHTSAIALTKFVDDVTNLKGYDIFKPNVAVSEGQETQTQVNAAQEDLEVEAGIDMTGGMQ